MAHKIALSFFLFCLTLLLFSSTVESQSGARVYLQAQCRGAVYHDLCVKTLLPYVTKKTVPGPQQIAKISLAVCLLKAKATKAYVSMVAKKLNETKNFGDFQAVDACVRQISNGVDQITLSVKEFQQMGVDGEEKFMVHEGNVQSWVSAALTDADMCVDGLLGVGMGGREKAIIRARIVNVKQLASNSLAMFNRYAMRHRASRIVKNP